LALLLALTPAAFAAAAATPNDPTGIWAGEGATLVVYDCGRGSYTGQIVLDNDPLPFTNATADAGTLKGRFTHGGDTFDFTLALTAADAATLTSGTSKRALKRTDTDPFSAVGDLIGKKEYDRAWAHLRPLADQGQPHALFVCALMHQNGWGGPPDAAKANEFYERAAAAGHRSAMLNLGVSHRDGRGTKADPAKALEWFKKAALRGDAQGARNYGAIYANGQGVPADLVEGYAWLAFSGDAPARESMEKLAAKLSPEQLERANARAKELAAERDRPAAPTTGGVGITLEMRDGKPVITALRKGSRAEAMELKAGDVLERVNNEPVAGKSLDQVNGLLAGEPETMIQLSFRRGDAGVQIAMPREPAGR